MTVVLITLGVERHIVAVIVIAVLLATRAILFEDLVTLVDWDVIGLIMCMSIYSIILEISGFAKWITYKMMNRTKNALLLLYISILICGIVSLILENSITVLIFAPIAFEIATTLGLDVRKLLVGMALAAGMSGSATMVGDPPAIIIAGHYNLAFTDFIIYKSKPSMFFITLIPMIIAIALHVLYNFKYLKGRRLDVNKIVNYNLDKEFILETTIFLFIKIILLSLRKELKIPLVVTGLVALIGLYLTRLVLHRDFDCIKKSIREGFNYKLPLFLVAIFLLSNSLKKYGVTDVIADYVMRNIGVNVVTLGLILFAISATLSAFIENIPVTLTLLPIIDSIATRIGVDPIILVWGVLSGLTAGGGYTYIGGGANIVAVHMLDNRGFKTTFIDFAKIALLFNISNTILALILYTSIWLL
jgi:Na+/H+ antiporter NhaD/arsenite permease-like protein